MAEEQRWQEAGTLRLCANNCGFFGTSATLNLCSKCYKDYCIREQHIKDACFVMETSVRISESPIYDSSVSTSRIAITESISPVINATEAARKSKSEPRPNRCGACKKRVGLTGFTCRCGVTFCGSHRYPEKHGCEFDYKALGKEAIAKANPVVKAQKLNKI